MLCVLPSLYFFPCLLQCFCMGFPPLTLASLLCSACCWKVDKKPMLSAYPLSTNPLTLSIPFATASRDLKA